MESRDDWWEVGFNDVTSRTISSQLPTPAPHTEITTSSGAGDVGAGSSSMPTSPPNASMPAARILRIVTTGAILEP